MRAGINRTYPFYCILQDIKNSINRDYYADEPRVQLRLRVKITRGEKGVISRIGTRLTSPLCQLRANDIPVDYEGETRQMFLNRYFGGRPYYEYDVKSSIYRVAYFLRTGEWLNNAVDLYALMSPYPFATPDDRAEYKKGAAMQLYFGGSPQKIAASFYDDRVKAKRIKKQGIKREELTDAIAAAQQRMFAVVGESLGSEVMLHESAIYLMLLCKLLKMGLRVVSVYDEFIADDTRLTELVEKLLPKIAAYYREKMLGKDMMEKCTKD